MKILSFVIGLAGLVTWLEPRLGFFVSYLAFFLSFMQYRKQPSRFLLVSCVLGVVGFVLSLVHLVMTLTVFR